MASIPVAEKCAPITRAAAKRRAMAAALVDEQQLATKKRAVLGDLTNLANVVVFATNPNFGFAPQKPKCETKKAAPEPDNEDPQLCGPYASDIYAYLRRMEVQPKRRPLPDYMETIQKDVNANMRGILVDWLVEVADEFKLIPDTLYLSVAYVDKYLSINVITKKKLQLLGVASMFIASKYEEINPPNVDELSDMTYTKEEVIKMEADILKSLKFEMGNPTVRTFLRKFIDVAQGNYKTPNLQFEFLVSYLAELSLLDYKCVKFLPSMVAASVIFLARLMIRSKMNPWCSALQQYTGYKAADLRDCVLVLHDLYLGRRGGSLQVVRAKYKQHKAGGKWGWGINFNLFWTILKVSNLLRNTIPGYGSSQKKRANPERAPMMMDADESSTLNLSSRGSCDVTLSYSQIEDA